LYKTLPPNGLYCFCGCPDEETKRIIAIIEPPKPINHSVYRCDSRFHTEELREQLCSNDPKIGFVIMDGHSASFHVLVGNTKETIWKTDVDLPKKHGRGGQSQNRFARIRDEKRGWYVSKVAEAFLHFFTQAGQLNVSYLIFAGCANFKNDLAKKFDSKINDKILGFFDIQYGGEAGFYEAIEVSAGVLKNSRLLREQNILSKFFDLIATDGAYCYSPSWTMASLENGSVDLLLLCEELKEIRFELISKTDPLEKKVVYKEDENSVFEGYDIGSACPLLDWILEHHNDFGTNIELVSSASSIANQFIQGFGGIGGILRFKEECPLECENQESDESEYDYVY